MPERGGLRIPVGKLEWGMIFTLLMTGGSAIFSAGVTYAKAMAVETRVDSLEKKYERMPERLASIEANLNFLVSQYKVDRETDADKRKVE
jgi:hypothetical protein